MPAGPGGTPIGQVDPALMSLIRRLAVTDRGPAIGDSGSRRRQALGSRAGAFDRPAAGVAAPPPNLIRAHRDELRQASRGTLDHMVIDVIGILFDQILSDPKVPPQMARQIARLQLPVLRAALGDPTFFSSRRHPVRRFVNRIASLGAAFEDFDGEQARGFLAKVRELVQEIVEGDFDQIEIYEQKLAALEAFIAEQARQRGAGRRATPRRCWPRRKTSCGCAALRAAAGRRPEGRCRARLPARLHQSGLEPGAAARRRAGRRRRRAARSACAVPAASCS